MSTELLTRLSKLEYFAAHAPRIPDWFMTKERALWNQDRHHEIFFAWRKYYAEQMVKELGE